jgi:hypothetical protein
MKELFDAGVHEKSCSRRVSNMVKQLSSFVASKQTGNFEIHIRLVRKI